VLDNRGRKNALALEGQGNTAFLRNQLDYLDYLD